MKTSRFEQKFTFVNAYDAFVMRTVTAAAHDSIEPFNGCAEMLLIKRSESEVKAEGPHRVVVTARYATGSVWSKTVVIPQTSN